MSRRSRRDSLRSAQERSFFFSEAPPSPARLRTLEHTAGRFWEPLEDFRDKYYYSISTYPNDSRRITAPVRQLGGYRKSSLYPVRATMRTRVVSSLRQEIEGRRLADRALACAKRTIRKEVIFALRLTSKGAGARRRLRRFDSSTRC